jgi:hypothetical protein
MGAEPVLNLPFMQGFRDLYFLRRLTWVWKPGKVPTWNLCKKSNTWKKLQKNVKFYKGSETLLKIRVFFFHPWFRCLYRYRKTSGMGFYHYRNVYVHYTYTVLAVFSNAVTWRTRWSLWEFVYRIVFLRNPDGVELLNTNSRRHQCVRHLMALENTLPADYGALRCN